MCCIHDISWTPKTSFPAVAKFLNSCSGYLDVSALVLVGVSASPGLCLFCPLLSAFVSLCLSRRFWWQFSPLWAFVCPTFGCSPSSLGICLPIVPSCLMLSPYWSPFSCLPFCGRGQRILVLIHLSPWFSPCSSPRCCLALGGLGWRIFLS